VRKTTMKRDAPIGEPHRSYLRLAYVAVGVGTILVLLVLYTRSWRIKGGRVGGKETTMIWRNDLTGEERIDRTPR
jgi:hypothetical protein